MVSSLFTDIEDGRYHLKIDNVNKRSLNQNAYFHSLLPAIMQGLHGVGYTEIKDIYDCKAVLKAILLKRKITNPVSGDVIEIVKDTHTLTTIEFAQFIEEVLQWSSMYLGIVLPTPGEQIELKL